MLCIECSYAIGLDESLGFAGLSPAGLSDLSLVLLSNHDLAGLAPSRAGLSPVGLGPLGANLSRSIVLCCEMKSTS